MKKIILLSAAAAALAACNSGTYTINGKAADPSLDGKTVYLTSMASRAAIDSAVIANGAFAFRGKIKGDSLAVVRLGRLHSYVVLEGGDIDIDLTNNGFSASGTGLNDKLAGLFEAAETATQPIQEQYEAIMNEEPSDDSRARIEELWNQSSEAVKNVFLPEVSQANAVGAMSLLQIAGILDEDEFDSIYMASSEYVKNFAPLRKTYDNHLNLKRTAEGQPFVDFTVENGGADGQAVKLSDYVGKGKYVLVDFWASWCGPCRREIPVIAEVYEKYAGDKFDVLGIAVWDEKENTLKAAEELGIVWPQILDAQSVPTQIYGIEGIPHIILFGPDGTIVARGLRGESLKAKIAEVMAE